MRPRWATRASTSSKRQQPRQRLRADRAGADVARAAPRRDRVHRPAGAGDRAASGAHARRVPGLCGLPVGVGAGRSGRGAPARARRGGGRQRGRRLYARRAEGADKVHTPNRDEQAFGEHRGNVCAFAHAAVRAGADLVLGSGPHVLRGIELYRGRLIAHSLGNLAGFHNFALGGRSALSAVLRVRVGPAAAFAGGTPLAAPGRPRPRRSPIPPRRRAARLDAVSAGLRLRWGPRGHRRPARRGAPAALGPRVSPGRGRRSRRAGREAPARGRRRRRHR
jgi:hypothetical protein